jgi:PAS domain S-box-containing protein
MKNQMHNNPHPGLALALFALLSLATSLAMAQPLKVGIYHNPPSIWIDDSGEPLGRFAELLNEIATREGWQLEYVPGAWAELKQQLEQGEIDLLPSISYSEERDRIFDFTQEPVAIKWGLVYLRPNSGIRILPDLHQARVAINKGGIHGRNFRRLSADFGIEPKILEAGSLAEVMRWVEQGKADAGVVNSTFGDLEGDHYRVERSAIVFSPTPASFAVPEGRHGPLLQTIDAYLRRWRQDQNSIYYHSYQHWYGGEPQVMEQLPPWIYYLLAALLMTTILAWAWQQSLSRRVAASTRELAQANQRLRRERDFSDALFDTAAALSLVLDQEGRILRFNKAAEQITGHTAQEVVGKTVWELFIPPAEQEEVHRVFDTTIQGMAGNFENHWRIKDGNLRMFSWSNAAIAEQGDKAPFLLSIGIDVTEQRKMEEELQLWAHVFRHAEWGVVLCLAGSACFDYVNPAFARQRGYDEEEMQGMSIASLFPPEQRAAVPRLLEQIEQQGHLVVESEHLRKDGSRFPVQIEATAIHDSQGKLIYRVAYVQDISERKAQEARLRRHNQFLSLLSRAGDSFSSSLDLGDVLDRVLREILDVLGITSDSAWVYLEDTQELQCRHAIGPSAKTLLGYRLQLGQGITGTAAQRRELILVRDTRSEPRHYKAIDQQTGIEIRSVIALPLVYRDKLQGVLVCVDDTPDRFDEQDQNLLEAMAGSAAVAIHNARLFTEMVQLREQAESANRAKSAFLANMSHELRTPLNAVLGYAQILLKDPATPPQHQRELKAISSSGNYLLLLINDILDLAKIEAGRFELFATPLDPRWLFEQIHDQFRFKAQQKGLNLKLAGLDGLPGEIELDEKRLRQIVMNLLSNAVKFTEQGEVALTVEYAEQCLRVTVSDTGIGIDDANLQDLFTPYSQAGEASYRRQGTGLGLAISKSLVARMGGELRVESRLGEGSRFIFHIPAPASDAAAARHAPVPQADVIGYQRSDQIDAPLRLLVVDDQPHNRQVLKGLLTPLGFEVELAISGEAAVQQAIRQPPDLVLMDIVMPQLDGLETTRRLLAHHPDLAVVTVSALAYTTDREQALAAGCIDHLNKPVQWEELLTVLKTHLPLTWKVSAETPSPLARDLPGKPTRLDLSPLPQDRLTELEALILHGNSRALARFATDTEALDPTLANHLRTCLESYDYDTILEALAQHPQGE